MAIPTTVAEAVKLFGLPLGADAEAVRKRYRELAKQHHPDTNPNDPLASQQMAALNAARDMLKNGIPAAEDDAPPPPRPQAAQQRPAQTPAEREETHEAFRAEMRRARRNDAERARRRRAARTRSRREAEARAQHGSRKQPRGREETHTQREAAQQPRHSAAAHERRAQPAPPRPRQAPPARPQPEQAERREQRGPSASAAIERSYDVLEARGWGGAVAAARGADAPDSSAPPGPVEVVLSVLRGAAAHDAAVVIISPTAALPPALLERAIAAADRLGAPYAFVVNGWVYRRANRIRRTRTQPKPLSQFPSPEQLRSELEQEPAGAESDRARPGWQPQHSGRLF